MLERNVKIEEYDYHGKVYYAKKATKIKTAVRLMCGECMGMCRTERDAPFPSDDIKGCTDKMCPLFEWRMGENPYKSEIKSERMRKRHAERNNTDVENGWNRRSPKIGSPVQGRGE